jgi:hypothetical protein
MRASGSLHEESWLLLPWLANGRLPPAERARVEEHVRECELCAREVAWQRRACEALAEPDRVTYAPGPSFRKLMERIDGRASASGEQQPAVRVSRLRSAVLAAWRPPGLAWAASFVLVVGLAVLTGTAYRWSQPLYAPQTASAPLKADVLHIAFERSLSIGDVEELLRAAGARVVEGPGTSGIFGVTPVAAARSAAHTREVSPEMRALAARLRADARVRWVEPLPASDRSEDAPGRRAPQP